MTKPLLSGVEKARRDEEVELQRREKVGGLSRRVWTRRRRKSVEATSSMLEEREGLSHSLLLCLLADETTRSVFVVPGARRVYTLS